MNEDRDFIKAKECAYRLLSYRQRSVKEIKDRLEKNKFTPNIITKTVKYLREIDYLNDENFAEFWIRTKLRLSPVGWSALRYQLRQKGVAEQIIDKAISNFAGRYDECDVAKEAILSRVGCYKNLEPFKLKKSLYSYLSRRGFPREVILKAINQTTENRKQTAE
jgi:regulatory protein